MGPSRVVRVLPGAKSRESGAWVHSALEACFRTRSRPFLVRMGRRVPHVVYSVISLKAKDGQRARVTAHASAVPDYVRSTRKWKWLGRVRSARWHASRSLGSAPVCETASLTSPMNTRMGVCRRLRDTLSCHGDGKLVSSRVGD